MFVMGLRCYGLALSGAVESDSVCEPHSSCCCALHEVCLCCCAQKPLRCSRFPTLPACCAPLPQECGCWSHKMTEEASLPAHSVSSCGSQQTAREAAFSKWAHNGFVKLMKRGWQAPPSPSARCPVTPSDILKSRCDPIFKKWKMSLFASCFKENCSLREGFCVWGGLNEPFLAHSAPGLPHRDAVGK